MKTITDLAAEIFQLQNKITPLDSELSKLQTKLINEISSVGEIDDETRQVARRALGLK